MKDVRIPHSLRLVILLLRIALGLNFFYFGTSALFNLDLGGGTVAPFINLSASLAPHFGSLPAAFPATVAFIIGICLVTGLFTRIASLAGMILAVINYAPLGGSIPIAPVQFANNITLVALCFLILFFGNAGRYFGLDSFIHLGTSRRKQK